MVVRLSLSSIFTYLGILLKAKSDTSGRKYSLCTYFILHGVLGLLGSTSTSYLIFLIIPIFATLSPSSNEIGPHISMEMAGLSQVIAKANMTLYLSWFKLFGACTSAIAITINSSLIYLLLFKYFDENRLYLFTVFMYSGCQMCLALLYLRLSSDFDITNNQPGIKEINPIKLYEKLIDTSKESIFHILDFYLTDSYASSYITLFLIILYLQYEFHISPLFLSFIISIMLIFSGLSDAFDDLVCSFFGLVRSVIIFQFPANIVLIVLPFVPYSYLSILLLIMRYSISQFDSPIRNAYVNMVIVPRDRSGVNTIVNTVRVFVVVLAPYFIYLFSHLKFSVSFAVMLSGWLKLAYVVVLVRDFLVKQREIGSANENSTPSPVNQPHSPIRMQ